MTTTKKRTATQPATNISDCNFTNTSAANEHTRAAVEALANAAARNADAIAEIARALKGGNASTGTFISIGG